MPNEFIARKGLIVSGSTISTGGFTGSLAGSSSFATTASYALTSAGIATTAISASFASTASGLTGGTTNYIPLWSSATEQSSSAIFQNSGLIGIGTVSPAASLQVQGNQIISASTLFTSSLNIAQTWNNAGTTFTGIRLNVTDTTSSGSSLLMDLQVGGTSQLRMVKNNMLVIGSAAGNGAINLGNMIIGNSTPFLGIYNYFTNLMAIQNGQDAFAIAANAITIWQNTTPLWFGQAQDAGLRRDGATATLAQRNGTNAQTFRIYSTFTDANNYERGAISASSNGFDIAYEASGSGAKRPIRIIGAPLTGSESASALQINQTWNTTGTPTALLMNITDTTSNASSLLMDLQVGGASRFQVSKSGDIWVRGTSPNAHITFGIFPNNHGLQGGNNGFLVQTNNNYLAQLATDRFELVSTAVFGWKSGNINTSVDLGLARDAANILAQRNGTSAQTFRIYNTFTNSSNYERAKIEWSGNTLNFGTEQLGIGVARSLALQTSGSTRMFISSSGNIGIGMTSPDAKLTLDFAPAIRLYYLKSTYSTIYGEIKHEGDSTGLQITARGSTGGGSGTIRFFTAEGTPEERLRITSTGTVGIGTSIPGATLHVQGNVSASSYTGSFSGLITSASVAATASGLLGGTANYIPLWLSATQQSSSVIIQSNNNIGIKTTPTYTLDVYNNGASAPPAYLAQFSSQTSTFGSTNQSNAVIRIQGNNGSNSRAVELGIGVPSVYGLHDTGFLNLGGSAMWNVSSGVWKWSSNATASFQGISYKGYEWYNNASDNQDAFTFYQDITFGVGRTFWVHSAKTSNLTTAVLQATSAGGANFSVLNNGNVGIGTSSPDANLTVFGQASFNSGSLSNPGVAARGDLNTGMYFPAADTIGFVEGGVEAMRIDSSGNVGIGTSSPTSILHVAQSVTTGSVVATFDNTHHSTSTAHTVEHNFRFRRDGGQQLDGAIIRAGKEGTWAGIGSETKAYLSFLTRPDFTTASLERVRITSTGTVGIGTSAPGATLHVQGNVSASSFTGSFAGMATTASGLTGGTANYIPLWTSGTAQSSSVIFQSGSSIGIRTVSPTVGTAVEILGSGDPNVNTIGLKVGLANHTPVTSVKQYGILVDHFGGRYAPHTGIYVGTRSGSAELFGGPYFGIEAYARCSSQAYQIATGIYGQAINDFGNFGTQAYGIRGLAISANANTGGETTANSQGGWGGHFTAYGRGNVIGVYADAYFSGSVITGSGAFAVPLLVATNGVELMRVSSSGNVGIGTSTPGATLHVQGNVSASSFTGSFAGTATTASGLTGGTSNYIPLWTSGTQQSSSALFQSSGLVGIGTIIPSASLHVDRGANTRIRVTGGNHGIEFDAGRTGVLSGGTDRIHFQTSGLVRAEFDSNGRLGVGRTPSAAPVDVLADSGATSFASVGRSSDNRSNIRFFANNATTEYATLDSQASKFVINSVANNPLIFATNNTERMTLDVSGNLGIRTTPSAWGDYTAVQMGGGSVYGIANRRIGFIANAFGPSFGNFTYQTTNEAGRYEIEANTHYWFTAPLGTAGTSVTFTQAMVLTGAGNLGVGGTSAARIHSQPTASNGVIVPAFLGMQTGTGANTGTSIRLGYSSIAGAYSEIAGAYSAIGTGTYLTLATSPDNSTAAIERLRIDSSGRVGIGTTSPTAQLTVSGSANVTGSFTVTGTATVQSLVETSTQVLKKDIAPIESTLPTLAKLEPSRFKWIDTDEPDIGLVAEKVEPLFPDLIKRDSAGNLIGVKYSKLTVLLLKAIQEMSERIEILEQKSIYSK